MKIEQCQWTQHNGWHLHAPGKLAEQAQLLLVFGNLQDHANLLNDLQAIYPNAYCLGCSTAGEIYDTQVTDNALVITAIAFEATQVKSFKIHLDPDDNSFQAGDRLGSQLDTEGLAHLFVLSDGLQVNGSDLVRGLSQHLPIGVAVTGGLSADGANFRQTWVMLNHEIQQGMVAAIGLYGDRLKVGYGSRGGFTPFGPERVITQSDGNVLYKLDDQSALELYRNYLGEHAENLPASGLLFPLSLQITNHKYPLVRTLLAINEADQSMTFAGDVPLGSTVRLMQASFANLTHAAVQAAEAAQQALGEPQPELAILISCVGRKLLLKQRIEEEVEEVREVLGEKTVLTGFYSYGEICPCALGLPAELHNQTMTITTFAEI
ncbi:FIST N-terminal domain-containing protein [Alkalinema sp. FACHB-956]|uniref:FIST signal transduction protein n=1 Tax=Alkalinema sp. FACHB-956 TaxID=2692768 RepID=UPI001683F187|nr:FIST N-terminal domain-containing protein [Alkalinema sp. FACHB-956]MBD2327493.1 FIST C-terminal domain-containing protein [Alkalinema sp. FACHB-956]